MNLEQAKKLALETDYACEAVGEEINTVDAAAFFLEGYEYAQRQAKNNLLSDVSEPLICPDCGSKNCRYIVGEITAHCRDCGLPWAINRC